MTYEQDSCNMLREAVSVSSSICRYSVRGMASKNRIFTLCTSAKPAEPWRKPRATAGSFCAGCTSFLLNIPLASQHSTPLESSHASSTNAQQAAMAHSNDQAEDLPRSLDRATFGEYKKAQDHTGPNESISSDEVEPEDRSPKVARNILDSRRMKELRTKAKTKTKEIFHRSEDDATPTRSKVACLAPPPSSAIENDRLFNALPENDGMQAKDLIHHPVDTVRSAMHGDVGAKFADVMDNQVISHAANVGLVRASDKLEEAQNQEEKTEALNELEVLKKERQDQYVRWTMDRHVLKVRQEPPRMVEKPHRKHYTKADGQGKVKVQWTDYGQQVRYTLCSARDFSLQNPLSLTGSAQTSIY